MLRISSRLGQRLTAAVLGGALALGMVMPVAAQDQDATGATTDSAAVDLRVTLNRLLGEHGTLAIKAMRAGLTGAPEFEAAANALEDNTADLQGAITSVYGEDAGAAFGEMWRDHIGFFVDYTVGLAQDDDQMQEQALERLAQYRADFSAFLAGANPNLEAETLSQGLQVHVNQLVEQINAYDSGDFATAYELEREAYMHLAMTGDLLAWAIVDQFPDEFPGVTNSPAADLRVALNRLLAEHGSLAIGAMRAGLNGAPDFEAAAGALEGNTADLQGAIASVYGEDAGVAFGELWRDHIGFFVDYTVGLATDDDAAREQALERLAQYRADFSQFLAGANPNIEAETISEGLQVHVNQLVEQIDAYEAGDFARAYELEREGFMHLAMTGDLLAAAIVQQFPEMFKPDMPPTDTASENGNVLAAMLAGAAALVAVLAAVGTRRLVPQLVRRS
jgi:hypothetical protein